MGARAFVVVASVCLAGIGSLLFAQTPPTGGCDRPEYHQFDFWIGDWDVFEATGAARVAQVRVDRLLDGCLLREDYRDANGLKGQSLSSYDPVTASWQQTWITNRGQLVVIHGRSQGADMIFRGTSHDATDETGVRARWTPEGDRVRETAERSTDGGRTWRPWFDLIFRPSAGPASPSNDAQAVAELDAKYQEAVKKNDAATMDRILADDFVLVTGTGRIFEKRDLLDMARSGRRRYEHQEDVERSVRVWGDSAVVTAKLWEKGIEDGKPFDDRLWFSDTYVRTPSGWRYVFGQASRPLP
jgi:ketosteroid isomerase-like protein